MVRGRTGRYHISSTGGEEVRAFVPEPLPPTPPLEWTPELQRIHERALLACGRLDAITTLLPDPEIFLYGYVRREAVLSSQIEGTQSSLSDLLMFELDEAPGAPVADAAEVSNYVAAMEHGYARIEQGFPLSNRLLREVHELLLSRGRGSDKHPGTFRRSQNWIGGTRPGNAQYVPPPPEQVEVCMGNLEEFLHAPDPGPLIKAALAHVQFESIHPFLDGNGRVGRLLIALLLQQESVLRQPLLYLSLYLKQHRAEYYRLLDAVRSDGDWEAWVIFFLEGVVQSATSAVETAHRLLALFQADKQRVQSIGRQSGTTLKVFDALCQRPIGTIGHIAKRADVSFATSSRAIETLKRLDIVNEITGRARDRVFVYRAYVMILNEGAELT